MNVLITGADGLLGSNLTRELLARNYEITALIERGKTASTLRGLPIKIIEGDVLDPTELEPIIATADAVFHCAANTSIYPARSEAVRKVNLDGTTHVVNACLKFKVQKLVYVGTANSFNYGSIDCPGTERNTYGCAKFGLDYMDSKKEAQDVVLNAVSQHGLNAVVVNPTFMLGSFDSKPSSGAMILGLVQKKVPGFTDGGKNFINVKDAAVGIANALTLGRNGECYIIGNENLSFKEIFDKICEVTGAKKREIFLPNTVVKSYGKINSIAANLFGFTPTVSYEMTRLSCEHQYFSAQKAVNELKLPQGPIEEGIRECFNWFATHHYLTKKS